MVTQFDLTPVHLKCERSQQCARPRIDAGDHGEPGAPADRIAQPPSTPSWAGSVHLLTDFDATLGFPGEGPSGKAGAPRRAPPLDGQSCTICDDGEEQAPEIPRFRCIVCASPICWLHSTQEIRVPSVNGWRPGACRNGQQTGSGPHGCCRTNQGPLLDLFGFVGRRVQTREPRSRSPRIALPDHGMNTARTDPDGGSDRYQPVCEPSAAPAGNDGSGSSWEVGPIAPEGYAEHPWAVDPETAIGRDGNRVVYSCQLCRMSTAMWPGHHVCTMRHLDRLARNSFQPGEEPPLVAYVERTPIRSLDHTPPPVATSGQVDIGSDRRRL